MNSLHAAVHRIQGALLDAQSPDAPDRLVISAQLRVADARRQTDDDRVWQLLWAATAKLEAALLPGQRGARLALLQEASGLVETHHDRIHIGDPDS